MTDFKSEYLDPVQECISAHEKLFVNDTVPLLDEFSIHFVVTKCLKEGNEILKLPSQQALFFSNLLKLLHQVH